VHNQKLLALAVPGHNQKREDRGRKTEEGGGHEKMGVKRTGRKKIKGVLKGLSSRIL